MCVSNLSSKGQKIKIQPNKKKLKELIIGAFVNEKNITLDPFQTIWLSN